ncbi:hypothetical protein [Neisseria iguanae]|uniref:GAF domain-containing protein n=1 Tax=Neisseria iguanae TaxID=90242 RepID=A0A2P7U3A5_9NEIS|nr:hypothetical protein [Neisseria iguanae]PSJ81431.1 hypothetical protein C7N83_00605 [Neisseria iguanae]
MPRLLIKDFLQTQGLKLSVDSMYAAYAAAQAVANMGNAAIDRSVLWPEKAGFKLTEHIQPNADNDALLKQIFMALDLVYSRQADIKSAAVYAHMPSETLTPKLVLLTWQGVFLEPHLDVNEDNSRIYLASRTAQSGWVNIASNMADWLALGEISGERNAASQAQVSVPVCTGSGAVLGVVHIEFNDKNQLNDAALTEWTALSLVLSEPMKALLNVVEDEEVQHG